MGFEDSNSCTHTSGYVTAQRRTNGHVCERTIVTREGRSEWGGRVKIRVSSFQWFENTRLSTDQFEMVWPIIGWCVILDSNFLKVKFDVMLLENCEYGFYPVSCDIGPVAIMTRVYFQTRVMIAVGLVHWKH